MVDVACTKCGARHQLADAEVPPSGKVIKCSKCGQPVTVMPPDAAEAGFGPPPTPGKRAGGGAELGGDTGDVIDLGEPLQASDLSHLPAPKRPSPLAGARARAGQAPRPSALDIADLPAPKRPSDGAAGIADLPAPKRPSDGAAGIEDLPAPKRPSGRLGGIEDLPAPKRPSDRRGAIEDLPAPKRPGGGGFFDEGIDLPKPVGTTPTRGVEDLPAPKHAGGAPAGDLPAPKGFFDDIPAPTSGGQAVDLPAPKGFFDDIPAPKSGGQDDDDGIDLPAPRGFFDDVPAPRAGARGAGSRGAADELPAPKGFFDDVPAPKADTDALDLDDLDLAPPTGALADDLELAPPSPAPADPRAGAGAQGEGLDLGDDDAAPLDLTDSLDLGDALDLGESLDLESPGPGGAPGRPPKLELDDGAALEQLDLAPSSAGGDRFDAVDLPGAGDGGGQREGASFTRPKGAGGAGPAIAAPRRLTADADALELDDVGYGDAAVAKKPTVHAPDADGRKAKKKGAERTSSRVVRIALVAVLGVTAAGAGGLFFYQRHQEQTEKGERAENAVARARTHLRADTAGHWLKAARAAEDALRDDGDHEEALGLAAQGHLAAALDEGIDRDARLRAGKKHVRALERHSHTGPEAQKAQALALLMDGNPGRAIERLGSVVKRNGDDPDALLYLGWAQSAAGDHESAVATFERAVEAAGKRKVPALYGLGKAQLALGNKADARASFRKVLELDNDHIGAHVGAVEASEAARFSERETEYLAITRRGDLDNADPRAVARAWTLAGDEALRAGRLDPAKTRYDQATKIDPHNLEARVGRAKAALLEGRLGVARQGLTDVRKIAPDHVDAAVTLAEVVVREGKLDEAEAVVDELLARDPPLPPGPVLSRVHMVRGAVLAAREDTDGAIAAYENARELAGDDTLQPSVALATLYGDIGKDKEALELLRPFEERAEDDAALAVTLGVAFKRAGKLKKAEQQFRAALARRPDDTEARLQLGLTLFEQEGRTEEAIAALKKAFEVEAREDVGLQLAHIYEQLERDEEAGALYETLVAGENVTVAARARAARFYSRTGRLDDAVAMGEAILEEQPRHAAGFYLRGEGRYAAGNYDEALSAFQEAVAIDPAPQYLDALGRANEKLRQWESAMRAYAKAVERDPKMLHPYLGMARIKLDQKRWTQAFDYLEKAKQLEPNNAWVYAGMGDAMREQQEYDAAEDFYADAVKLDPEFAYAHYKLGKNATDTGAERLAVRALKKATKLADPSEEWLADAYYWLGFAARHSDKRAAYEAYDQFLARKPDDKGKVAEATQWRLRLKAQLRR